jgi:nucleoside-diphosphate kinase
MGPNNISLAKSQAPNTLRATFGRDSTRNAIHGSDTVDQYKRESGFFFSPMRKTTAMLNNCTCCIIKPHAV